MNIVEELRGKKILIWGYGREGKSTEQFLRSFCETEAVDVYEGKREGIDEEAFDLIIKSPGIVMHDDNPKYTSQTELFLAQFRNQVVGVTGTKGKSTTSSMLYTVLKECSGKETVLLGNIGQPCLDYFDRITEDTLIVFEMSCHQLAHTKVSPKMAVFLNLFEEHLDYYGTVDKYFQAKSNITKYQKCGDSLLVGENVPDIETKADVIRVRRQHEFSLSVCGKENQYNAEFVYYIATELMGLPKEAVLHSMEHFEGLAHRLEYVGTADGVRYYDDSISTIPEAAINAVNSIEKVQTVLIGGMDRKIKYDVLVRFIREREDILFICSYESGKRIYDEVKDCTNCYYTGELESAVRLAKQLTQKGNACVLSPAAASYGYFQNFEERGDMFKKYVMNGI